MWAKQVSEKKGTPNWSIDYRWQAEFWIRAFCDEVEKRAREYPGYPDSYTYAAALVQLKRELLGEMK